MMRTIIIAILSVVVVIPSCIEEPEVPNETFEINTLGTLKVNFRLTHPWLPEDRLIRVGLHIADNAYSLYRGYYSHSANVTDGQENYFFFLEPGTYYYEAIITCISGGDTCSAAGFPGNKWGKKHTADRFIIEKNKTTTVVPFFQ